MKSIRMGTESTLLAKADQKDSKTWEHDGSFSISLVLAYSPTYLENWQTKATVAKFLFLFFS